MIKIHDKNNLCYIAIKMWNIQIKWIPKKKKKASKSKHYKLLLHVKVLHQLTKHEEQRQLDGIYWRNVP